MAQSSQLVRLFRCIRWTDVLILQGAPVLGVAVSIGAISPTKLIAAAIFGAGSFLLVTHIFTFNDWADSAQMGSGSGPTKSPAERAGIRPQVLLLFSLSTLVASLLVFLSLSLPLFLLAATIAALGIFYSHPSLNAKSMPIVSTLLHLVGGLLHFLLGYALFSQIDRSGLLIGSFFGLTFAAGHPVQEVRDFHEDHRVGAKTNAIAFGSRPNFFAGLILFSLEYFYLFALAWSGVVPRFLAVLPIVFYPIHILWSVMALRDGLTSESIVRFQIRYRILYALIGLTMLFSFFNRH